MKERLEHFPEVKLHSSQYSVKSHMFKEQNIEHEENVIYQYVCSFILNISLYLYFIYKMC